MNNLWNILLSVLTLAAGGGWLFDRRRHKQEVESLKADNRQKDMNLSKMYVDEFRENIADRFLSRAQSKLDCFAEAWKRVRRKPLRREVRDLRNEINQLRNAIQKINDCPHSDTCPVYDELQKQQANHPADPQ